jgi:hypothetical protein
MMATASSSSFRLRDMKQHIQPTVEISFHNNNVEKTTTITTGNITNTCLWEWNQPLQQSPYDESNNGEGGGLLDGCYGTFSIHGNYVIQPNGRIVQCPKMNRNSIITTTSSNSSSTNNNNNA